MYNIYIVFAYYIFVENGPGGMYKGTLPGRVETDIKSKYSIIAATYGNGKLVLFGQHPEVFTWEPKDANDYVWENYWHNKYKWYGDKLSNSYNYILIREAARWTLGLL